MLRNLKDAWGWIERVVFRLERLESGAMLGNSSITKGRMRFIGGLLLIDSGGTLQIIGRLNGSGQFVWSGDWRFTGDGAITGDVVAEGKWTQNGGWEFNGDGDIAGDVDVTGDITVLGGGRIKVGNVVLTPGNGGRVTIGTGSSQIIIDPTQLKVGPAFKIDPAHSSTGAQLEFGTGGESTFYGDDEGFQVMATAFGATGAGVRIGSAGMPLGSVGVSLLGDVHLPNIDTLPSGEGYELVVRSKETGLLHTFTGGIGGGPGDGIFAYPFPLAQVTSEFRPPDRPTHDGMDFGIGPSNTQGTPIPSAGSGVVETVGAPSANHGWGYYVLVNHGTDPLYGGALVQTRYAHMYQAPPVSVGDPVTLGMTLGGIGNTGNSFGNHLHWEVLVDGVPVNPRTFMAAHGG